MNVTPFFSSVTQEFNSKYEVIYNTINYNITNYTNIHADIRKDLQAFEVIDKCVLLDLISFD